MRRFILSTTFLAVAAFTAQAQNLFVNSDFSELGPEGMPKHWHLKGTGKRISLPAGGFALQLTQGGTGETSFWVQNGLKIEVGQQYLFKVRVKAGKDASYLAYVESSKPTFKAYSSGWKTGTGNWEDVRFDFKYENFDSPPYAVLRLKSAGEVLFTEPSLTIAGKGFSNGDFSEGLDGWTTEFPDNVGITNLGGIHGNAVKLSGDQPEQNPKLVYNDIQLFSDKSYLLSYKVKGTADKERSDSMGATWFRVYPVLDGKIPEDTGVWRDCFASWQQKQVTFKVAEDTVADLVCELRSPGEVWFDEITLQEAEVHIDPIRILLDPPVAHRNAVYSSQKEIGAVTGIVQLNLPGMRQLRIELDGKQQLLPVSSDEMAFELPVPGKDGVYPLSATAFGADGEKLATAERAFTVYPPAGREVTFRKDLVMLVNGQPFFPLGSWSVQGDLSEEEKAAALAEAGFNIWKTGSDNFDIAARHGLFTMLSVIEKLPSHVADRPDRLETWKEVYAAELKKVYDHQTLLGYFITDEPAWRGVKPEPIIESYQFISSIDPYKPIMLNEAPRGRVLELRNYVDACDIYGVDIYPVPAPNSHSDLTDKMMTSVGKYTDICREVVENRKPVWMTLQGFSWGAIRNRPGVYPTHAENRFMAYNAILHGATGLFYWGIHHGETNPEYLRLLGRTVREIRKLSPVLVTPAMEPDLKADHTQIRLMQRQCDAGNYYLVINESGDAFTAEFTGSLPGEMFVLFEDRSIETDGNVFRDSFAPYDVHVYSDKKPLPAPLPLPELKPPAVEKAEMGDDYRKASWIWYPDKNRNPGHRAWFKREFDLPEGVASAEMFITADDYYQLYLNDVLAGDQPGLNRGWNIIDYYDVTDRLKAGLNTILIKAADSGQAPCAMLCALKITDKQGNVRFIVSDQEFLSSEEKAGDWVPAEVLCKFGGGPWKNNVRVVPNSNEHLGKLDF